MRISAPYPEIGAPKVGKIGVWYTDRMHNFFPFFSLCTPFLKYYWRAKFWTGALRPPRDIAKKRGLLHDLYVEHCTTLQRPLAQRAAVSVTTDTGCPAAAVD